MADLSLTGRVAIVTGGSQGIGFAVARRLCQDGARVAIAARDASQLSAAESKLRAEGLIARAFSADVTDPDAVAELVQSVRKLWGPAGILVANAGGTGGVNPAVTDLEPDVWENSIRQNLTSVYLTIRAVLDDMLHAGWGRIVTVSSRAAVGGGTIGSQGSRSSHYAAGKAGATAFTQALSMEVAGTGVTANVVAPGPIATEQFLARRDAASLENVRAKIPVDRLGYPDDVAHAVSYLATDAGFVTGQVIHVNGGTWIG